MISAKHRIKEEKAAVQSGYGVGMKKKHKIFIEEMKKESFIKPYEEASRLVAKRLAEINASVSDSKGRTYISDISCRVKEPISCLYKMLDKKYAVKAENAKEKLNDIAGVRAVCYFLDDVYQLVDLLMGCPEYEFVKLKDYVKKPKASGYQSLHLIMKVPVGEESVKVEIQIRTQAMDFWSDIEHHFIYKTKDVNLEEFEEEFLKCSKSIQRIDKQMLKIRKKLEAAGKK